ncbi:uncharacterized protein LOC117179536 isoform X2 [Belonocnema kinseyi]|uniref:uncharacterized protein LOC117179536 isoform X2 n=1 Tax=Belonocnema kinseyi TaxID=2817044 RepID=UPI00143D3EAF|nr:uncharacterized protein LOC117179536 isoform X2 [Belonocnema kinseyi]
MDTLNDDCLILIFHYLPILDRLTIEKVCKRWTLLSRNSWSNIKRLDFHKNTWGSCSVINKKTFRKVIRLSAKYLTSIDIPYIEDERYRVKLSTPIGFRDICNILTSCDNIQELDMTDSDVFDLQCSTKIKCTNYEHKIVPLLMRHYHRITKIGLIMISFCDREEDWFTLFSKMKKLKSLHLSSIPLYYNGSFFRKLPCDFIEELYFTYKMPLELEENGILNLIMKKCSTLHTIGFENVETLKLDSIIPALIVHKNLKNLVLYGISASRSLVNLALFKLTHLETLDIGGNDFLDDALLELISRKCKHLTELNISDSENVTDSGILHLSVLPKLRHLYIARSLQITCPPFENIPNLEELDCSECEDLNEECLCKFVRKAPQLRKLGIESCPLISNKLLNTIIDVVKLREDNRALDIFLAGTNINLKLLKETPLLLNIHKTRIHRIIS